MSCNDPKAAILVPDPFSKTGRKIKFLHQHGIFSFAEYQERYGDRFVLIPCGHCKACIEQRTKSWAIRCTLEAAEYENNCFITLTYNDNCLPKNGLNKSDIFKFIKRLRNKYGKGIRYFGCGEYGSSLNTERPHYHAILFNFWPQDAVVIARNPYGGFYYRSKELQSLWPFGFVSIGEVSYNSCAYVARYCQKKLVDDGIVGKTPEFSFMSRRPGIGECYFKKHFDSLVSTDRIYAHINDNLSFSSFRYFDKLIERIDPEKLQELKNQRIMRGEVNVAAELLSRNLPSMERYLMYQEQVIGEKYNRLKRRLQ